MTELAKLHQDPAGALLFLSLALSPPFLGTASMLLWAPWLSLHGVLLTLSITLPYSQPHHREDTPQRFQQEPHPWESDPEWNDNKDERMSEDDISLMMDPMQAVPKFLPPRSLSSLAL